MGSDWRSDELSTVVGMGCRYGGDIARLGVDSKNWREVSKKADNIVTDWETSKGKKEIKLQIIVLWNRNKCSSYEEPVDDETIRSKF